MKALGNLLGDGRIMTLGLFGFAAFIGTALLGWALGVGEERNTVIVTAEVSDTLDRVLRPGVVGRLPGTVRESSGVSRSGFSSNFLWTHNDGSDGRAFLVRHSGGLAGIAHLVGVDIDDAEDIDVGPCPEEEEAPSCLYIADTGDNDRDRESYAILYAPEPQPETFQTSIRTNLTMSEVRFRYPGGSRDSEALAVTGTGEILVVTKGQEGSADIFRIPTGAAPGEVTDAQLVATLPLDVDDRDARITAAAFDEESGLLAVRSDETLFLFDPTDYQTLLHRCRLPDAGQGEGVDFLGPELFVLTREGSPAPIEIVACP